MKIAMTPTINLAPLIVCTRIPPPQWKHKPALKPFQTIPNWSIHAILLVQNSAFSFPDQFCWPRVLFSEAGAHSLYLATD